ncbi:MAG TPA: tripartite tricarboxylate transporter TctB family protein [Pseudorhizobium sp.]|nr:tripartite tricarboxylate transporter TctB family protein [Pseudorhizobium sp.]
MRSLTYDKTNLVCGLLFIALGGFFAIQSLFLELGTAFRMGPGYFPLILACVLILLGGVILFQSLRVEGEEGIGHIAWRGIFFILPAPIFFGLTVRGLGFVPALFLTAMIASFASSRMRPLTAILLAGGLSIFSVLVFSYGLGLPFRLVGPWLDF